MSDKHKYRYSIKDCGEEIRETDISKVIDATREYGNLSDEGEVLLQTAASFLQHETGYMWKNAKIAVLGPDIQLVFVSGYQSFQIVVTLDDNDPVNTFCSERGWKVVFEGNDVTIWGDIKGTLTNLLITILINLIRGKTDSNGIQKTSATTLRARKLPNGTGNGILDPDSDGEPSQDRKKKRGKWTGQKGVGKKYCCPAVTICVGMSVLFVAAIMFVYAT